MPGKLRVCWLCCRTCRVNLPSLLVGVHSHTLFGVSCRDIFFFNWLLRLKASAKTTFFPTSLCGVLVFRSAPAAPPPPPASPPQDHSSHTIHHTPSITHHSPLITLHSSHTTHHTPFITHIHHRPFITHHSSHTIHHTPLITHHSSHTIHHTPLDTHHSSHTTHHTPFITHHSTHTTHHIPLVTDHSSHTTHHIPLKTHHSSHTTHHIPLITHHSSHTTHHTPLITRCFCVAGAVQRASWRSCCALGRRWAPLGRALAFAWQAQYREPPEGAAARLVAAGRRWAARWLLHGRCSTESLLKELLRAWSPLGAARPRGGFCVASAVREPPEGAAARLVAAGRRWAARWLLRGRRSTESLLKELLRAWSPLGAAGPLGGFCVAGAVQRASWRSFCALGRRWAPLGCALLLCGRRSTESLLKELLRAWSPLGAAGRRWAPLGRSVAVVWQAQYREPPGGASARWLLRGRRSTESLLTELLRAWSPLGAAGPRGCFCVAGAVQRASWRSCCALGRRWAPLGRAVVFAWQAQYREPPEGAAARLVAAGRRWAVRWLLRGRRSIESLLKELLRAWSPLGAAGPCGGFCVAGAVQRASWMSFCALRRRWAQLGPPRFLCGRRSTESLLEELLRAWSPLGAAGPRAGFCVAGAVQRASWRSFCALGRRWAPLGRSVAFVWQAQYREPPGGASARMVLDFVQSHKIFRSQNPQKTFSVLVHCYGGINRSGAATLCLVMLLENLSLEEALEKSLLLKAPEKQYWIRRNYFIPALLFFQHLNGKHLKPAPANSTYWDWSWFLSATLCPRLAMRCEKSIVVNRCCWHGFFSYYKQCAWPCTFMYTLYSSQCELGALPCLTQVSQWGTRCFLVSASDISHWDVNSFGIRAVGLPSALGHWENMLSCLWICVYNLYDIFSTLWVENISLFLKSLILKVSFLSRCLVKRCNMFGPGWVPKIE